MRKRCFAIPKYALLLLLMAAWLCVAAQPTCRGATADVTYPFQGVTHYHYQSQLPRQVDIHMLEIDLSDAGIEFEVTPSNGALPGETTRQTTRSFVSQESAQIGINGSFYSTIGSYADVLGISGNEGNLYSSFHSHDNFFGWPALNLAADKTPTIVVPDPSNLFGYVPVPNIPLYNVISGGGFLVRNGVLDTFGNDPASIHPRTAVGYTADNKLLLFTVDGRNPGHSDGMRVDEVAQYMLKHGAIEAINMDGGGSTTLVMSQPTPAVVNVPSDGSERSVANNLAVRALPTQDFSSRYLYADFEFGDEGSLSSPLTFASQTNVGFQAALSDAVASQGLGYDGAWSQRISITNDASQDGGFNNPGGAWFVRHVIGQGEPNLNQVRAAQGYVGFWARTTEPGVQVALAVDDVSQLTADRGERQTLIPDNQWHLYQWNLEDASEWEAWAVGDGTVTTSFTPDSIQLFGPPEAEASFSTVVHLDGFQHDSGGSLGIVDAPWDGEDPTNLWNAPTNWARDRVPTSADFVTFPSANTTVQIDAVTSANGLDVRIGEEAGPVLLEMTGGSLSAGNTLTLGHGVGTNSPGAESTMRIEDGTVTVGNNFTVGFFGDGRLEMTGGTVDVDGLGYFVINETANTTGGSGHLQLDGGTITAPTLVLKENGTIDISGGSLIVNGVAFGARSSIEDFIDDGFITAYGGAGSIFVEPDSVTGFSYKLTAQLDGDFNFDGRVDGIDYLHWQRGESPTPFSSADLESWQTNYGYSTTSATTIPEPDSVCISLVLLCCACCLPGFSTSGYNVHRYRRTPASDFPGPSLP